MAPWQQMMAAMMNQVPTNQAAEAASQGQHSSSENQSNHLNLLSAMLPSLMSQVTIDRRILGKPSTISIQKNVIQSLKKVI